jgi:hypothetical protein
MAEREDSRSPDPPAQDNGAAEGNGVPAPVDNGVVAAPVGDTNGGEGVKLYVGNLDFGTFTVRVGYDDGPVMVF